MIGLLGITLFGSGLGMAYIIQKKIGKRKERVKQIILDHTMTSSIPEKNMGLATIEKNAPSLTEESKVNHYLQISGIGLSLATIGYILFPPIALLNIPILGYLAYEIYKEAAYHLKNRKWHISLIDLIAITVTILSQIYAFCAFLFVIYFASLKLLYQTRYKAHKRVIDIFSHEPPVVWLLKDGMEISVSLSEVQKGDYLIINAGEIVPIDGTIEAGIASIDQHILTGEAQAEEKTVGDVVFATTLVIAGQITVRVEKTGVDTIAANITQVLASTDDYITYLDTSGERIANRSVAPSFGIAGLALLTTGPIAFGAVLCSNFSEIMRFTLPLTMLNYLRIASQSGLLIKDGRSLEQLVKVNTVVFDKTGTLTLEQPHVGEIFTQADFTKEQVLYYTAAAEYRQTHPIACAILEAANNQNLQLPDIEDAEYKMGYGISVNLNGQRIRVGSQRFMQQENIFLPPFFDDIEQHAHEQGYSLIYTALDDILCGVIELHPTIRPEAQEVVSRLRKQGLEVYILSGDHEQTVKSLAKMLKVDGYIAESLPEDKARIIEDMQATEKTVCFVGDGINDSIALKKAAVSVSLKDASHIARDSAQILLMNKNLLQLLDVFEIAKRFNHNKDWGINMAVLTPSLISMGGSTFFGFTIATTFIFYCGSAAMGLISAMIPFLHDFSQKSHVKRLKKD